MGFKKIEKNLLKKKSVKKYSFYFLAIFEKNNYRKCFILAKEWNGFSNIGHLKNLIKFEKKNHFFGKCFTSKKKFQNFFLNFYPKSFPDIKNRNGFSKTGHLKILIRFEKKSIFRQVLHLEKKFRIFFLNIYPKS